MKYNLLFILLFTTNFAFSQKISEADSLLRRKYYHKIYPTAINSKSDVLYDGIDNVLEIQYPDEASKKLKCILKTHNGILFESDNTYVTIPRNAGRAFISTYIITENKDTILIGKKEFTVQDVPIPCLKIGGEVIKDQSIIDRKVFFHGEVLQVFFLDDIKNSENWCTVEYFNLGYTYGGKYISVDNKGALLSKRTLDFIEKLKPSENMVIKVSDINCSKVFKHLPLVRFKIR